MRHLDATGWLHSVELLPRDEASEIGGVRLELVVRAGVLGDGVVVRATVDSYCDDSSSEFWLRAGRLLNKPGTGDVPFLCHVSGVVHRSGTDEDGILHLGMVAHGVSPDISILARFPE